MAGDPRAESFRDFFKLACGFTPYEWQTYVALDGLPEVLPVPTGLGKTEVALAWAWSLLVDQKPEPLHLVVCLPMRTLVTQTVQRLSACFSRLRENRPEIDVAVHQLMGGAIDDEWASHVDKPWVLVGTQDQLLSRALNRGYSMSRFEWPIHFGLLNHDCRWLIDEVQLMGPGLWTTSQLDWMRRERFKSLKPCLTTWMSATVGTSFLSTTDRVDAKLDKPSAAQTRFEAKLKTALERDTTLAWWRAAKRPLEWWRPEATVPATTAGKKKSRAANPAGPAEGTPHEIAASVKAKHVPGTLSLVICNTVDMAREVFEALPAGDHKVLLTSRFRREDRARHAQRLIDFETQRKAGELPDHDPGLICVSTQVIEAGVDISAHRLFTELAPWASMLQRMGRLNRKGDDHEAQAWVWATPHTGKGKKVARIGPYEAEDIGCAKKLVGAFVRLSQTRAFSDALARLDTTNQQELTEALQPKRTPLPRALDVHGLFSTERDVHGGFTDISAFVRGTDPDLDVAVFWRDWSGDEPPRGDDLDGPPLEPKEECPVSFVRVQKMLETTKAKAWLWDDDGGRWERVNHWDIRPGMRVMLKRDVGGYDKDKGWTGDAANKLAGAPRAGRGATLRDEPRTEAGYWSTLEAHLRDARREAEKVCAALSLTGEVRKAVVEASGLHDLGKAHKQWQDGLPDRSGIPGAMLAKTPSVVAVDVRGDTTAVRAKILELRPQAKALPDMHKERQQVVRLRWSIADKLNAAELEKLRAVPGVRWAGRPAFRPGLRHEVASALAMWSKYARGDTKPYPALAVYLAATHHGKARTVMRSTTDNGDDVFGVPNVPTKLEVGAEEWPLDFSIAKDGAEGRWEGEEFVMTGPGWTGLVADLLGPWRRKESSDAGAVPKDEPRDLGPFALAYLEALVRVVDWRASAHPSERVVPGLPPTTEAQR